jgi:tetratricopeptide repeat protein
VLLAWACLEHGDQPVEAEHAARLAVRLAPDTALPRVTYAMVMKQLGLLDRARAALRDALAREPDDAAARHELAVLESTGFGLGRLARGARGFADALRLRPGQRVSRLHLDETLRRFLNVTTTLLGLLALAGWRAAADGQPGAARLLGLAAVLGPLLVVGYFAGRLDRRLRVYLRDVLVTDRYRLVTLAAGTAMAVAAVAVMAPAGAASALLECATLAALCARLCTVVAWNWTDSPDGRPSATALGVTGAILGLPVLVLAWTYLHEGESWALPAELALAVAALGLLVRFKIRGRRVARDD